MTHMMIATQLSYNIKDVDEDQTYVYDAHGMVCDVAKCLSSPNLTCCTWCSTAKAIKIGKIVSAVHTSCNDVFHVSTLNDDYITMTVPQGMGLALSKCTGSKWLSTKASCTSFVVTSDDAEEMAENRRRVRAWADSADIDDFTPAFEDDDGESIFPAYQTGSLLHALFVDGSNVRMGVVRDVHVGDIVVMAHFNFDEKFESIDRVGRDTFLRMQESKQEELLIDSINSDASSMDGEFNVVLVMRPLRGWSRVRHVIRVRAIVVYWLFLTETLMAPNGGAHKRDRDAFEADGF